MRSLRLAARLAGRNLRRRPAQAALLLLTLTLATGTFGVGIALYGSADGPWNRVWRATDGFHVSAQYYRDRDAPRADADLRDATVDGVDLSAARIAQARLDLAGAVQLARALGAVVE